MDVKVQKLEEILIIYLEKSEVAKKIWRLDVTERVIFDVTGDSKDVLMNVIVLYWTVDKRRNERYSKQWNISYISCIIIILTF